MRMTRQDWHAAVARKLREGVSVGRELRRFCAGQHREDSDEIAVAESLESTWEGYHIFSGPAAGPGTIVFSPQANRPTWRLAQRPPTKPSCGAPTPPPLSHFRGPKEKDCRPGQCCDATPYVCDDDGTYCRAVGFVDGRRCCAVRTEGTADRKACERMILRGAAAWTSDGAVERCNDNHLRAKCPGGCTWLQVCDASGAVCNRKDF